MKRYRVLRMDFDMRANILSIHVPETWDPHARTSMLQNQASVREGLRAQYGHLAHEPKLKNFIDLGPEPISIVSFHNTFFRQARDAFVIGSYYPALTATCALGERVLNHLVLAFRDEFQSTAEYRRVYRRDSFDNWDLAIDTLEAWSILLPSTALLFRELRDVRNRALHFNPETEHNTRKIALDAIAIFRAIVEQQFTAFGDKPWFIPNDVGISFVRRAHEDDPFVRRVLLPSCSKVGPKHSVDHGPDGHMIAVDPHEYAVGDVTDEEFIQLFKAGGGR
jgi:hypothetical protein